MATWNERAGSWIKGMLAGVEQLRKAFAKIDAVVRTLIEKQEQLEARVKALEDRRLDS